MRPSLLPPSLRDYTDRGTVTETVVPFTAGMALLHPAMRRTDRLFEIIDSAACAIARPQAPGDLELTALFRDTSEAHSRSRALQRPIKAFGSPSFRSERSSTGGQAGSGLLGGIGDTRTGFQGLLICCGRFDDSPLIRQQEKARMRLC
jgi:hypothetical protein